MPVIGREEILESLRGSVCEVIFKKITNFQWRRMYCTLQEEIVPRYEKDRLYISNEPFKQQQQQKPLELIVVWDVVKNDWRSFYSWSVERIEENQEKFQ